MNPKFKLFLGIGGTLIISILATFLYDIFLKTLLIDFFSWLLDFFCTTRDSFIYQEVAKGFHDQAALRIFSLIIGFAMGIYCVFLIRKTSKGKKFEEKSKKDSIFMVCFIIFFFCIQAIQILLVNQLITDYNQKLNIATPFMSDQERNLSISRFSSIKDKENYDRLIMELDQIINNQ